MTNQHPITPPPELVEQWAAEHFRNSPWVDASGDSSGVRRAIATQAAQWGSDQELEACIELLVQSEGNDAREFLRTTRRPKPPSLKEQLLQKLEHIRDVADKYQSTQNAIDDLRETLEALDD